MTSTEHSQGLSGMPMSNIVKVSPLNRQENGGDDLSVPTQFFVFISEKVLVLFKNVA